ncbi:MAG: tryptophan-rich sensory protein [Clostridia bacterium]|nr:tryptophan-rich sensory protein [Clostridia bacterium]
MSKINVKRLAVSIAIPLAVGIIASFITKDQMEAFSQLKQPPLSPPGWLFPIVWTVLYVLMGISSYIVYQKQNTLLSDCQRLYILQLAANFIWTILFFNLKQYLFSFIWLILLIFLVARMAICFVTVDRKAAALQIPYVLWICFAAYLNIAIYYLN